MIKEENTAAERAAAAVISRVRNSVRKRPTPVNWTPVLEQDVRDVIKWAIDKSTADCQRQVADLAAASEERQRQIGELVEALEEIDELAELNKLLRPIGVIAYTALAPFKKEKP